MKKTILILVSLILTINFSASAQEKTPVTFADPYILCDNGTYYLYGTSARDGIAVLISKDLNTWSSPKSDTPIPVQQNLQGPQRPQPFLALNKVDSYGNSGFWAPEVYKIGDKYYMYYTSEEHVCVATADSPLGPFKQDVQKSITDEKGIDCSMYIDEDGTPYLFWVRFTGGNEIWMAEMEKDLKTIKAETMSLCLKTDQKWEMDWPAINEGPFVVKHNGFYYLTYSANHYKSTCYGIGYATTADLKHPEWKKYDHNPVLMKPEGLEGTGHHSLFIDADGTRRVVFHSHRAIGQIAPRIIHLTSYGWQANPDGGPDRLTISVNYTTPEIK